jgi:molybdopterin-containing oxidoreductase family membrane subunit
MWIEDSAIKLLTTIVIWCLGIAIFLTLSEIVIEFYARTEHANSLYYLMFGLHGLTRLVPWFWSSVVLMVGAFILFLIPAVRNNMKLLPIPCAMAFVGIWIEKGMGLIVPGFIPSPIGEVTEYYPSFVEWLMTLGIWSFGFFVLTILLKGAIGILTGEVKLAGSAAGKPVDLAGSSKAAARA